MQALAVSRPSTASTALFFRASAADFAQGLFEPGLERLHFVAGDRHAGRHGVAAALDEQAALDRRADDSAKIDACDRARRAGSDIAMERDGEGRTAKGLLEPRGDEADDAGLPILPRGQHACALFPRAEILVGRASGLLRA